MAEIKKTTIKKTISQYLDEIGESNPANQPLIELYLKVEKTIADLEHEIETTGTINSKGRINPAYNGLKMFMRLKIDILTKLTMTVQDRNKLKLKTRPDAIQLNIDSFMEEASGF